MTDKELLRAAAKAAGVVLSFDPHGTPRNCTGMADAANIFAAPRWNPLADDGDAMRLAVKLGLTINPCTEGVFVSRYESEPVITEPFGAPVCAVEATRRAIVRAAAALAKEG